MDAMIDIGAIDNDQMLLQGMTAWLASTGTVQLSPTGRCAGPVASVTRAPS